MNNSAAKPTQRKGIRKLLHRWREKIRKEKQPKPQGAAEPSRKPTIQKRTPPAKTRHLRRNTAPADLVSSNHHPRTLPFRPGVASPTSSAPAPHHHQNRRVTTGFYTHSDIRAQIAHDEALLARRASGFDYYHRREASSLMASPTRAARPEYPPNITLATEGFGNISLHGTGPLRQWPWGK